MGAAVSENVAVEDLHIMAIQALEIVGFSLTYSATEITVSLFIFDKQ